MSIVAIKPVKFKDIPVDSYLVVSDGMIVVKVNPSAGFPYNAITNDGVAVNIDNEMLVSRVQC